MLTLILVHVVPLSYRVCLCVCVCLCTHISTPLMYVLLSESCFAPKKGMFVECTSYLKKMSMIIISYAFVLNDKS